MKPFRNIVLPEGRGLMSWIEYSRVDSTDSYKVNK